MSAVWVDEKSLFQRLKDYLKRNKPAFINLREPGAELSEDHDHDACLGYLGRHDGIGELWLTNRCLESIASGKTEADLLKGELHKRGILVTNKRGERLSYVVKRDVPGLNRLWMVALREVQNPATILVKH